MFKGGIIEAQAIVDENNNLSITNVEAYKGGCVLLPISMNNIELIKGVQFDLHLPEGVTVATEANDVMMFTLTNRADQTHSKRSIRLNNGDYRVVVASCLRNLAHQKTSRHSEMVVESKA